MKNDIGTAMNIVIIMELRYFQDEIKSVNERINPKLDSILNGLTHIIASQQLGETPEITIENPSLDNQILSTLPKDISDLYLEFDDIDAVNDAINRLLKANKIIEEKEIWRVVKWASSRENMQNYE